VASRKQYFTAFFAAGDCSRVALRHNHAIGRLCDHTLFLPHSVYLISLVQPPPPLPCPPPTSSSSSLSLTAPPLRPRPPATHGRGGTLPPHRPTAPPPTADPPAAPQPPLGRRQEIPQHRPTLTSIVGSDANQPPSATTAPPPQPRAAHTTSVSGIPPSPLPPPPPQIRFRQL
jgi:hypothetical protein